MKKRIPKNSIDKMNIEKDKNPESLYDWQLEIKFKTGKYLLLGLTKIDIELIQKQF